LATQSYGCPEHLPVAVTTLEMLPMNENFRLVFGAVLSVTLLCGVAAIAMSMLGDGSLAPAQQSILDSMLHVFQVGIGLIFGLLGGRSFSDTPKT
jgi:hypothetical protein